MFVYIFHAARLVDGGFTQRVDGETVIVLVPLHTVGAVVVAWAWAKILIRLAAISTLLLRATHFAGVLARREIARQQCNTFRNIPDYPMVSQCRVRAVDCRQIFK